MQSDDAGAAEAAASTPPVLPPLMAALSTTDSVSLSESRGPLGVAKNEDSGAPQIMEKSPQGHFVKVG